jgi:hypothetical protein
MGGRINADQLNLNARNDLNNCGEVNIIAQGKTVKNGAKNCG